MMYCNTCRGRVRSDWISRTNFSPIFQKKKKKKDIFPFLKYPKKEEEKKPTRKAKYRKYERKGRYLEQSGSSAMVSSNGFFDLHIDNLCLNSGVEYSSISSKFSLVSPAFSAAGDGMIWEPLPDSASSLILPADACFTEEFALMNRAPMSAAVTTEFSLFIGNMAYTLPISRSSSAPRAENLRPMCSDWEFTTKKEGSSSMSSATLVGLSNTRTSPPGKITFAALYFPIEEVAKAQET